MAKLNTGGLVINNEFYLSAGVVKKMLVSMALENEEFNELVKSRIQAIEEIESTQLENKKEQKND